ncbi:hypothetical protein WJX81_001954 [Elliptochloris bilobata]|uniref:WW domain-containing protein n=1 Tax=Elliptochloris bilobata TaxID=381761 RepID=A0AAW1RVF4_9CHLO
MTEPDPKYYFFNEMTQEVQWDDPGDVPYEEEGGTKYWLGQHGEHLDQDPRAHLFTWVESYSDEHERPFFYNQQTKVSTWERPPDLAWRRVPVSREEM